MGLGTAQIVICGAGIAGIATAYELAVRRGVRDVVLVERGDPLALTSDKSTEAYRNWWPGPGDAMVRLIDRSIDLVEQIAHETANAILLNRRGYLFATGDAAGLPAFVAAAREVAANGTGRLRGHGAGSGGPAYVPAPAYGFEQQPVGADLIVDPAVIRAHFPYLTPQAVALLHVRRAGWFGGRQLGMHLLEQARAAGVRLVRGELRAVEVVGGRVCGVTVATEAGSDQITTPIVVGAAGPLLPAFGRLLGIELPLYNELHLKASIDDTLGIVPRDAPMLIWADPIPLPWGDVERTEIAADPELRWLLNPLPAGVHARPEGGADASTLLLLWDYHTGAVEPVFPITLDEQLTELALRGMATMVPALAAYLERVPRAYIDGGYYTRTRENRPLIGPLPVEGAFINGGFSGFGLMAACGAAELLGAQITGTPLPAYAPAFDLNRYTDPSYLAALAQSDGDGQL